MAVHRQEQPDLCGGGVTRSDGQDGAVLQCYIVISNERQIENKYVKEKLAKTRLNQIKGGFPGIFAVYLTVYLRFIGA